MESVSHSAELEPLPTEILFMIVQHLFIRDVKCLSCVNQRMRMICLPVLFNKVRFAFSDFGLDGLRRLALSDARQYVVSLTYVIPELLRAELMDLEFFRHNILPPDHYADLLGTAIYDGHDVTDIRVPYMLVYETFGRICHEQKGIVERREDLTALSTVLSQLPHLIELGLCFCPTLATEHWISSFMDRTVERCTYFHHFQVISNALEARRRNSLSLHTIRLSGLELPYYCSLRTHEAQILSNCLNRTLEHIPNLRLSGSGSPLRSLSGAELRLQQLDMCSLA
ncbi:hypothetical protein N7456_006846, partial [Penicillium angulare]